MDYYALRSNDEARAIIIAEAGINHDGNLEKAKKMVDVASNAGANYVKFQSFRHDKLVTPTAVTSSYIKAGSYAGESFADLLHRLEMSVEDHRVLKTYCDLKGIKFLSTAFDAQSFDLLLDLGIDLVKVASGDITNIPLLRYMAKAQLPMIVSTGMATLGEIESAIEAIAGKENNDKIILLHCISWYPAEIETTNLRYLKTLKNAFGYPVGYSDHTLGLNMSIAAKALGAKMIEKHFTLDAKQFGPDHAASIEPNELMMLIKGVREVEAGLGSTVRSFGSKEINQRLVHRRSIVASQAINVGELFSVENLIMKRPGTGIAPKHLEIVLGKKATKNILPEQLLAWSDISNS